MKETGDEWTLPLESSIFCEQKQIAAFAAQQARKYVTMIAGKDKSANLRLDKP